MQLLRDPLVLPELAFYVGNRQVGWLLQNIRGCAVPVGKRSGRGRGGEGGDSWLSGGARVEEGAARASTSQGGAPGTRALPEVRSWDLGSVWGCSDPAYLDTWGSWCPHWRETRMSESGNARRILMLKVIFLRPGNMVVLCLIEKEVSLILVLDPNFEYKTINGVRGMVMIFTKM